jgi:superfamily II DNA or RNA helicase
MGPGAIVRCRGREWVLLPSEDEEVYVLRPLLGTSEEAIKVHKRLSERVGYALPSERVVPAVFPFPRAEVVADAMSVQLVWQAARLTLREGATPFRSLGRISIRPRRYQFVPLLMALRMNPVRLFIADDVGVGKTIEALLIARELLDRGEIQRFCVLCPPYLCDQWAKEITEKFHLEPVVIRSSTIAALERQKPPEKTLYEYFHIQVISIDFIKTDRNRHQFLQFCPELVIVDEAHGCAKASEKRQQERYDLLSKIARVPQRHLILLTATPHSGIAGAFQSLLGLLRPEFAQWDLRALSEAQYEALARHFVQRTRKDIEKEWEGAPCFPQRESWDVTYELSEPYRQLFEAVYDFCRKTLEGARRLGSPLRRLPYWSALTLLRCVMSSPAAALAAFQSRSQTPLHEEDPLPEESETLLRESLFERVEEYIDDETPPRAADWLTDGGEVEEGRRLGLGPGSEASRGGSAQRRAMGRLATLAKGLLGSLEDSKLQTAIRLAKDFLREGYAPIFWCRYVATAEYLAEQLRREVGEEVQVLCVTGRMSEEEREARIAALDARRPRILVATDCLSEGINLQAYFNAVVHYDLPWNPNRLEQREGRVDRYGQPSPRVRAIRLYGRDNPVDGVVIDVLLNKAREIYRTLGTYVPVPQEDEATLRLVLEGVFLRGKGFGAGPELPLELGLPQVQTLHGAWDQEAQRESEQRRRFAQRALGPEAVESELQATDAVLGSPEAVKEFLQLAAQKVGLGFRFLRPGVYEVKVPSEKEELLKSVFSARQLERLCAGWQISLESPPPAGAEYVGRNHWFVAGLAQYILEGAMERPEEVGVARCGVIRTRAVQRLTALVLLRVRYLTAGPRNDGRHLLLEEVRVVGWEGLEPTRWLDHTQCLHLLTKAQPDANIPLPEKQELIARFLELLQPWEATHPEWGLNHPLHQPIRTQILQRAAELSQSYQRLRQNPHPLQPHLPPDLLGLLVLQPLPPL